MNDHDHDRAEQAFRTALRSRADSYPATVVAVPAAAHRRRWPALLAVAALVVAVVVTGLLVRGGRDEHAAPADLPAGWRWESFRDVMVGVPDSWGSAAAPDDQWCVRYGDHATAETAGLPKPGYVDSSLPGSISTTARCPSDVPPARLFAVHLSFRDGATQPAAVPDGWTDVTRTLHAVTLDVVTDPAHRGLADRILATAHTARTDQNGCDTTSPLQAARHPRPPAFDVTSVTTVDSIAICQYDVIGTSQPGLLASRLLTGEPARRELAAVQAAEPIAAGRAGCHDELPGAALVLRLTRGEVSHDLYLTVTSCFGNAVDDGTQPRQVTTADCSPVWGGRVVLSFAGGPVSERCVPPKRR